MKYISKLGIAVVVVIITTLLISGFLYLYSEKQPETEQVQIRSIK